MVDSLLRKAALVAALISIRHRDCAQTVVAAESGHHDDAAGVQEFAPPKLSFSASNYLASLGESDGADNGGVAAAWTVFQGVPSPHLGIGVDGDELESARLEERRSAVRRRSGPLLALFPGNGSIGATTTSSAKRARHAVLVPSEQRSYLEAHAEECRPSSHNDGSLLERYDLFAKSPTLSNLASELWKYCTLYVEGGIYVDAETAPLAALGDALEWDNDGERKNYAVVADTRDAGVSPSLLNGDSISDAVTTASSLGTGRSVAMSSVLAIATKKHGVPHRMIAKLTETPLAKLEEDALLLPRALLEAIEEDEKKEGTKWGLLKQRCNGIEVAGGGGSGTDGEEGLEHRTLRHCPAAAGYCCEILDPRRGFVFLLSRQALVPNQILPHLSTLPQPYGTKGSTSYVVATDKELPFLSTLHDDSSSPLLSSKSFEPGTSETTPNVYELLSAQGGLPNQEANRQACMDCMREKGGADCGKCGGHCPGFCGRICDLEVKEKPLKKVLNVVGPRYRKDPQRYIPRIVHQTWFEPVTPEKYPNMSRLIESWKLSGWEYHFWDDASAAEFLSLHFPPEVREAYDSILPGAFKADLFRYCVLLIVGGIYADMDVMLESNLDAAVPPDVGFMVPVDAPGTKPDHRMCLWNGMIASAPGHPFLSRVIEHVVNNIRNRFTVVDYDRMMCPDPELSVVHAFSTLFTAGPCILGLTVNEVMGRDLQQTFVEGDLEKPSDGKAEVVPGRTIILQQNKWDMGAHRFTWVENNLVVAATDMPDYDDRKELEGEDEEQAAHYSKTLDRHNLYGQDKVYVNRDIAHERIVLKAHEALSPISSVE